MNVLNVVARPDERAGTELAAHASAAGVRQRDHRVYLLHDDAGRPAAADGYDGAVGTPPLFDGRSKRRPAGFAEAVARVEGLMRDWAIDVVHVHSVPRLSAFRWLIGRVPTVVTVHVPPCPNGARYLWGPRRACDRRAGLVCLTTGYRRDGCGHLGNGRAIGLPGFVRGMWLNGRFVRLLCRASRVVAISRYMRDRLVADGVPAARVAVVPSAVLAAVPADRPDDEGAEPPAVLFVGRAVSFKGADHLLAASARVTVPHRVWVVGGGAEATALSEQAARLGITDRVELFGHMDPGQISGLRSKAAVAVVPSLWPEAFGRVGVEALADGLPVVAYDVGGVGDWLADGVTGRLVPAGDVGRLAAGIDGLLRDPVARRQMGRAGVKAAAAWTVAAHATVLVSVFEEAAVAFAADRPAVKM